MASAALKIWMKVVKILTRKDFQQFVFKFFGRGPAAGSMPRGRMVERRATLQRGQLQGGIAAGRGRAGRTTAGRVRP